MMLTGDIMLVVLILSGRTTFITIAELSQIRKRIDAGIVPIAPDELQAITANRQDLLQFVTMVIHRRRVRGHVSTSK
jgi:hypothetical protein